MPTVEFPDNIFDAPDPWVVLGTIALVMWGSSVDEDTDLHDEDWHNRFSRQLRLSLDCFDLPVHPSLSATNVRLCHKLDQDYSEQRSFSQLGPARDESDWVYSHQGGRLLRLSTTVTVAVATFLRSKEVDFYGCQRCHAVCMESFTGPSAVGFEVGRSGEYEGLGSPSDPNDTLRRGQYSSFQGSLEVGVQEPVGMEAFTNTLCNTTLSEYEKRSQLVREMHKLYVGSFGLDMSDCFHHSDGGNRPCLEEATTPRCFPGHSTSTSSKLSKSDKIEETKNRLLEMLRQFSLPYERLPWSTLEKDLEKIGYALVNWPTGVLRRRGNRGIHDLSAVEVNKLYEAITCPDEPRRLRICRRPSASALTVVPVQPPNPTAVVALGSKRPAEERDLPSHQSKRIRFRDMTSKVMQRNLGEGLGDEAAES
ncbi:hypothetical protein EDC04DRAFT_3142871 [Pisolithus marmoratus]|nr:hypothetical protein EDC04DRAFT_3142871 [Pisolithus marmoratus]